MGTPAQNEAAPIREAGTAHNEFLGADREVVVIAAIPCALLLFAAVTRMQGLGRLVAAGTAVFVWISVIVMARSAAKKDPLYYRVLWRAWRHYQPRYEARPTPHRRPEKPRRWYR